MQEIKLSIPVFIGKEGESYVTYSPALELSSYGDTVDKAKEAFEDALQIFIDETLKKGTLEKCLLNFGWSLRKIPFPIYDPPNIDTIKDSFSRVFQSEYKNYYSTSFRIPA